MAELLALLQPSFMQRALVALLLLAPMSAAMGVQVVNHRLAFFSDAVSHSAFAGVAVGLLCAVHPHWTMPLLGVAVGVGIVALQRNRLLSSDTAVGVLFAAVTAAGLAVVSRHRHLARELHRFLYGDVLTMGDGELLQLAGLLAVLVVFLAITWNRLVYTGVSPTLAQVHQVPTGPLQYGLAALLSLVVVLSVWAMGVLLVTALLIVPAAAARNLARSARGMFWWAVGVSTFSSLAGLVLSALPAVGTATGATIVLVAVGCFLLSLAAGRRRWRP
jgi:zinc transport system permease protein